MLLDHFGSLLKIKGTVFCFSFVLLVACDIRLWSHFSGSIILPAGHFRSGLQLPHFHPHSLGNPSICIPSSQQLLAPFTSPQWTLAAWCNCGGLTFLSTAFILTSVMAVFSLHPSTITHVSGERVFPIPLPEKENLSYFPLVSAGPWELWFPQMNSVREPDLIEKT